jgi:hypothetical protein
MNSITRALVRDGRSGVGGGLHPRANLQITL